jgi:hypothetical protein
MNRHIEQNTISKPTTITGPTVFLCYDNTKKLDVMFAEKLSSIFEQNNLVLIKGKRYSSRLHSNLTSTNNSRSHASKLYNKFRRNSISTTESIIGENPLPNNASLIIHKHASINSTSSSHVPSTSELLPIDHFEANSVSINTCVLFIIIISNFSLRSADCCDEMHYAYELKVFILYI